MSFWDVHGLIYLIGLAVLPRITLFLSGTVWGFALLPTPWPVLAWIGFFVSPSLVIAMLATMRYWDTNPILCVIAWLIFAGKLSGAAAHRRRERGQELSP